MSKTAGLEYLCYKYIIKCILHERFLCFLRCKKWSKVIALFVSTFDTMFAKSWLDPGRLSQFVREGRGGGRPISGGTSTTISQALYEKDEETGDEPTPFANTAWFKSSQMTFGVGDASRAYFSFLFAGRVGGVHRFLHRGKFCCGHHLWFYHWEDWKPSRKRSL